jgi:hypothetical protein
MAFPYSVGSILWFDPRREHSSVPTAKSHSRRAQGLSRLAASSRPPEGLGLDWPEHGGMLDRIGLEAAGFCARTGQSFWPAGRPQANQSKCAPANPSIIVLRRRADAAKKGAVRACRIGKTGTAPI